MTETVASLSAQLETLNAARASGARTVSYSANGVSRSVEYRSDIEMRNAQWDLQQRIAALQAGCPRRTVLVAPNKGVPARLAYRNRFPEAAADFGRDRED
jgi:hypothetical protein